MKTSIFLLLFSFLIGQSIAQTSGDIFFDQTKVHEIKFTSENQNLLDDMYAAYNNEVWGEDDYSYQEVDVTIDGELVESVGLRVKGGITAIDPKKPLKIDFNEFVSEQEYDGIKKVNLHNVYFDQSGIREALSYDILRTGGLKAPRFAFTEVYINEELQGLYLILEQIDKTFLNNYFADDSGVLYKDFACEIGVKGDSGTLAEFEEFESLLLTLSGDELKDALSTVIDVPSLMHQLLLQNLMNTSDNIFHFNCNYYIYHEPKSDLLYYIPWDFNLSLFDGWNFELMHLRNLYFEKLWGIGEYRTEIQSFACETLNYNFTEVRLFEKIEFFQQLIQPAIERDPLFPHSLTQFMNEAENLKLTITNRISTFENGLNDLNVNCESFIDPIPARRIVINEILCSSNAMSGIDDGTGSFPDWIELYNPSDEEISLEDIFLSDDKDFLKHWKFPDGISLSVDEYLIIWADRDLDETGLHADFKLAKSSGQLFLTNEDFSIVDSLSYGPQETNFSLARIPNGVGDFVKRVPTFAMNNGTTSTSGLGWKFDISLKPNPVKHQCCISYGNESPARLEIFAPTGGLIKHLNLQNGDNCIDVVGWSSGLYQFRVSTSDQSVSVKLLKL